MADDDKPDPADDKPQGELGDAGKKALDEERKARREAEKRAKEFEARLKEIADRDKSETDKLRDQVATLTKERDELNLKVLRHEVAMTKGLTPAQAKRLAGSSREELEADADEILEAFPTQGGVTPPPSRKPAAELQGGGDPTSEPLEMDPAKLAADLPRY